MKKQFIGLISVVYIVPILFSMILDIENNSFQIDNIVTKEKIPTTLRTSVQSMGIKIEKFNFDDNILLNQTCMHQKIIYFDEENEKQEGLLVISFVKNPILFKFLFFIKLEDDSIGYVYIHLNCILLFEMNRLTSLYSDFFSRYNYASKLYLKYFTLDIKNEIINLKEKESLDYIYDYKEISFIILKDRIGKKNQNSFVKEYLTSYIQVAFFNNYIDRNKSQILDFGNYYTMNKFNVTECFKILELLTLFSKNNHENFLEKTLIQKEINYLNIIIIIDKDKFYVLFKLESTENITKLSDHYIEIKKTRHGYIGFNVGNESISLIPTQKLCRIFDEFVQENE